MPCQAQAAQNQGVLRLLEAKDRPFWQLLTHHGLITDIFCQSGRVSGAHQTQKASKAGAWRLACILDGALVGITIASVSRINTRFLQSDTTEIPSKIPSHPMCCPQSKAPSTCNTASDVPARRSSAWWISACSRRWTVAGSDSAASMGPMRAGICSRPSRVVA